MFGQVAESLRLHKDVAEEIPTLAAIASSIAASYQTGGKVLLFGNGGSAASAEHWAAELTGRFSLPDRPPLAAVALTANAAQLTAIANDFGYEAVFARLVEAMASKGDVVIGISTSGKSANVLRGLEAAQQVGAVVVGFTGQASRMETWCDYLVCMRSDDTPRVQECHDFCAHLVFAAVEALLFGRE